MTLPERLLTLCLGGVLLACGCRRGEPGARPLRIAAASSLAELAADIAAGWTARGGEQVSIQLGSSSTLARQIAEGAPVDLFLSADPEWVDVLPDVLGRTTWLTNRLAWVIPLGDESLDVSALPSLVLGAPGVPVGRYARAWFQASGTPLPQRLVYGSSARDVLAKVAAGAARAGLVYATDAPIDPRVRVASLVPPAEHPPIRYEAAALTSAGGALLDALDSPWVSALARARGFRLAR